MSDSAGKVFYKRTMALLILSFTLAGCSGGPTQAEVDATRNAKTDRDRIETADREIVLCRANGGTPSFQSTQDPNWGGRRIFVTCTGMKP